MSIVFLSDRISYLPGREEPLSADVGIVEGDRYLWLYDVGCGEEVKREILDHIQKSGKEANVIISHFHADHLSNLQYIPIKNLYVSGHTLKYTKAGEVVAEELCLDDGIDLHIFNLPSTHAKGSLCLETGDYCFVGDGTYCTAKDGKPGYNSQLLKGTIETLEKISAGTLLLSHFEGLARPKSEVLEELHSNYRATNGFYFL